ncbi:phosphodiester glycosidase family protein [Brevibacillus sp. SIMBA_076]|uniref:phosphodiester glycosidase family protein n=1 Tax=Brevibacillus sp. SIMBA_076 TaxID=3085814 RepID=UPI0039784922
MKVGKWVVSIILIASLTAQPAVSVKGEQQEITKSISTMSQTFTTSSGKRTAQIVRINLNDSRLEVRPVLAFNEIGKTQSLQEMAKQNNALAAINGTFFMAYNKEDPKPPWGMIVIDFEKKNEKTSGSSIGFNGNLRPVIMTSRNMNENSFEQITSAGPTLVQDGKVVVDPLGEGMQDPKLTTLSAQRSFIGYTADNQLVMGTVPNVTLNQLAVICQSMGLQAAMNLDGGASSGLYAKGKLLTRPGRNLSNTLIVVQRKSSPIQVKWDSQVLSFSRQPVIINGSVYVLAEEIFAKLGAKVTIIQQEKIIAVTKEGREIHLWESGGITVDGGNPTTPVRSRMIAGKLMIPIRFAAEMLDTSVQWDSQSRTATIATKGENDKP